MKKVICPYCDKEIETLIEDRVQRAYYDVKWDNEGEIDVWDFRDYDTIISSEYYCPECDKKVAKNVNELGKKFKIKA